LFAEQLQSDEVTRAEAARLERGLERASTHAGEVLQQRQKPLVGHRLGQVSGHTLIIYE
jgi:hypothetical protein